MMNSENSAIYHKINQLGVNTVLVDSRSAVYPEQSVFFALPTATNDGHKYVAQLLAKGVPLAVVSKVPEGVEANDARLIMVADVAAALQGLAAYHRQNNIMNARVIAVAGSRGKTIVKEWLSEALHAEHSPRSFNSQIGVPLSLLAITGNTPYAVVEAGVSELGEMDRLEQMIAPDIVVLTDITSGEHRSGFVDFAEKCQQKLILARNAKALIYPAELEEQVEAARLTSPIKIAVNIPPEADWLTRDKMLTLSALNYICANSAPDIDEIVRPLPARLSTAQGVNNCLVIADKFTCDLHSLPSALDFMHRRVPQGLTPTLLLGRLTSAPDCRQLASLLKAYGVQRFLAVGREYAEFASILPPDSHFYDSEEEMLARLTPGAFSAQVVLAKGEEGSAVARIAERLQARHHETVLEVNLDALVHNFNQYRAMVSPGVGLVAMVKASGYGIGAVEPARTLQSQGAAYLAVAVVDEGEELRRAGITMPIMALNPKVTNYDALFANLLEPEVFSFDMLDEIINEGARRGIVDYPIHLKFDTGMHRLGFLADEIPALLQVLKAGKVVKVRSIFSHLATADCLDMDNYTLAQLASFEQISTQMRQGLDYPFMRHILNSAGIARFPQWQYDMVRLGIGLYGVDTLAIPQTAHLRPVASLRSIIIAVKEWPAGTSIGYARRTILNHDARIATVPVGYADGLSRHLGNGVGSVWVNGVRCPIVGNVCMDACMVDITSAPNAAVETSVEFFGENIPIAEVAATLNTIPYEILTSVSPRVKRVYYRE